VKRREVRITKKGHNSIEKDKRLEKEKRSRSVEKGSTGGDKKKERQKEDLSQYLGGKNSIGENKGLRKKLLGGKAWVRACSNITSNELENNTGREGNTGG